MYAESEAEAMEDRPSTIADDPLWYKDAIIYELHVRSFFDSNGDGTGDFPGLIQKLDYLQDLGVTCIWLLPFYPSPLRDDGYDIADYQGVNPAYGTLDDFQALVKEAHHRGLRVITELVVNHTSDRHPWFQRARQAPPGSRERDFYVWSDTDQKYAGARVIFLDYEKSNWTWDPEARAYYWHRFFSHQPDLNHDNPAVHQAVLDVLRFWVRLGVDGLRLDAVPYLIERDGTNCENLPQTHQVLKAFRRELQAYSPDCMLLAEANQWPIDVRPYFGDGDECQMAFHFPLMPRIYMAISKEDRFPITETLRQTPEIPQNCQWALFLRNHDELTLEMVTSEERDYLYKEYAKDPHMRLNLGIRRRLAPLMNNRRDRIQLMNSLLFSLAGTPVIYYGDELGMGDNIFLGDRNGVRTPMQWSGSLPNGGFSQADPSKLCAPADRRPHLRLSLGQRGVSAVRPGVAAAVDEAHDRHAQPAPGLRPGNDDPAGAGEPQDPRLSPPGPAGDDPGGGQSLRLPAAGEFGPVAVPRLYAGGDVRPDAVPGDRRGALFPQPGPLQFLLVRASTGIFLSLRERVGVRGNYNRHGKLSQS